MLEPLKLELEPLAEFLDAIKAPETRRNYVREITRFLNYVGCEGKDLKDKARDFVKRAKERDGWAEYVINSFLGEEKARFEKGEIQANTLRNYKKPIVLFTSMNDIPINWKKIGRKLPTGRDYAADRAPTT